MCVCVDDRRLPKELCVGYFVVVVGNETKCAALGDAAYAAAIECLGGSFVRCIVCIQSNFWGGAPPLCDLSEAAENLIQPPYFLRWAFRKFREPHG